MRAVDAGVLVRCLLGQPAAEGWVREQGPVWISHLVLAETVRILEAACGRSREQVAEALAMILDNRDLVVEDPDLPLAALARFQAEGEAPFETCLALERARRSGHLPFATFEGGLAGVPGVRLLP